MEDKNKHLSLTSILLVRLRFIMIFLVVGGIVAEWGWVQAYWERLTRPASTEGPVSEDEWYCPMHPSVVRSAQGNCPICGMPLSHRKRGEKVKLPEGVTARLQLSPYRIRQAGVATTEVHFQTLVREIRAVGYIEYDERRMSHISARVAGRADELYINFVGTRVKQGDPVYQLYSPDVSTSEEEYLSARKNVQSLEEATEKNANAIEQAQRLADAARERLKRWGITSEQIDRVEKAGKPETHITIFSPVSGIVIEKDIHVGHYLKEGDDPYTIVDDSIVWMQAEVFERDMGAVELGQEVAISTEAYSGESFQGTVSFISPTLSPETRTVKVRVDVPNPDGKLKPGMYTTAVLRVPAGKHGDVAYTCCAECGGRSDKPGKCPKCSKALTRVGGIAPASARETYYTCPMHPEVVSNEPGTCPKCNMNLEKKERDPVTSLDTYYACPMHPDVTSATEGTCGKCGMALKAVKGGTGGAATGHVVETFVCPLDPIHTSDNKLVCPECHCEMKRMEFEQILAVPFSAVIDTGEHKVVFVDQGNGVFEAVELKLGPRAGEFYPVLGGDLKEGSRVVTAGAFLLDAETRLNPAASAAYFGASGQEKKPK